MQVIFFLILRKEIVLVYKIHICSVAYAFCSTDVLFFISTYGKIIQHLNWGELQMSERTKASTVRAKLARGCRGGGGARGQVGAARGSARGPGFRQVSRQITPGWGGLDYPQERTTLEAPGARRQATP